MHTPLGVASDIGTQFLVALDHNQLVVGVREGRVRLQREHDSLDVQASTDGAGEQVTVSADGTDRKPLAANDPSWEWTLDATHPFQLDGARVHELVAWVARQNGLSYRYASEAVAQQANMRMLSGGPVALRADVEAVIDLLNVTTNFSLRRAGNVIEVAFAR